MSIDHFLLIKTGVHILCCTWHYVICIIIRKKVIKLQYSKLSFGGGSCLFSATCWGWVTNILWHYEGVGHVFLRDWVFISSGPPLPPLYFLTSPLGILISKWGTNPSIVHQLIFLLTYYNSFKCPIQYLLSISPKKIAQNEKKRNLWFRLYSNPRSPEHGLSFSSNWTTRPRVATVNWMWNSRTFSRHFRTFSSKFKDLLYQ